MGEDIWTKRTMESVFNVLESLGPPKLHNSSGTLIYVF